MRRREPRLSGYPSSGVAFGHWFISVCRPFARRDQCGGIRALVDGERKAVEADPGPVRYLPSLIGAIDIRQQLGT